MPEGQEGATLLPPLEPSPQEPGERFGQLRERVEAKFTEAEEIMAKHGHKVPEVSEHEAISDKVIGAILRHFPRLQGKYGKTSRDFQHERLSFASHLARKELEGETDPLTGLPNRKGFEHRLQQLIERELASPSPEGHSHYVFMGDLNGLKAINDKDGHEAGDRYIKNSAKKLSQVMRVNDVLAHIHGDEFTGILYRITPKQAQLWLERVNEQLKQAGVNISIGTAQLDPSQPTESIKAADIQMRTVKNQYYIDNPHLHRRN